MNINRHNYEAILLDYLEGRLTPREEAEADRFLAENPDLMAEFEALQEAQKLSPDVGMGSDFSFLKKPEDPSDFFDAQLVEQLAHPDDMTLPTLDEERLLALYPDLARDIALFKSARLVPGNEEISREGMRSWADDVDLRDAMLVAGAEGDWSEAQRSAFDDQASEVDRKAMAVFGKLRLKSDVSIGYPSKSGLYRTPVVVMWHRATWLRVAAAVVLLLSAWWLIPDGEMSTGTPGVLVELQSPGIETPETSEFSSFNAEKESVLSAVLPEEKRNAQPTGNPQTEPGPTQPEMAWEPVAHRTPKMWWPSLHAEPVSVAPVEFQLAYSEEDPELFDEPSDVAPRSWERLAASGVEDLLRLNRQPEQSLTAAIFDKATAKLNESEIVTIRRSSSAGEVSGWRVRIGQVAIAKRDR